MFSLRAVLDTIRTRPFFIMNLEIRSTQPVDIAAIIDMIRDFAAYENLSEYCEISEDRLAEVIFGKNAFVESIVALDGEVPVGYAIYYKYFSSFRGQSGLYLEDIYIDPKYRGKGVGEAMLKKIAKLAASRGFERIDFQVLEWNTPAIKFYEKLGAIRDDGERHFKFTDQAFTDLVG